MAYDDQRSEPYTRFYYDSINGNAVLIVDYMFWNAHEEELARWLQDNTERGLNTREGMMLYFASEEEMTWFLVRWA